MINVIVLPLPETVGTVSEYLAVTGKNTMSHSPSQSPSLTGSQTQILDSPLMVFFRQNPDMMTMFTKRNWIRICHTCGEYVGNTALWIVHCLNSRRHMEIVKCNEQSKWDVMD